MGEKRTVIYKLERHKWPDEIEAEKKARRRKFAVVCSCLLFFAAGFFVAKGTQGTVVSGEASAEMQKLESVYTILNEDWYFGKDIQDLSTTLLEKAISAMAYSESDPHTYYMSQEDAQNFSSSLEGTFVGIGIQFYQNAQGQYVVSAVFENSPAQKAGLQRGDLIILAARPAMGKTALALNLGMYTALRNPGAVAFFSLEMPAESLMKRLLSAKSQVEGNKLRGGNISDDELNRLNEAGNELGAAKIFIDDSASIKVSQIFSKCRKLMSEYGLSLIVIDYLQLISGSGRGGGDNRQQEVSEISRNLKILAKEMNCPVIALSQLSRSVEQRTDKQPMLSDLRESGAIEQDADIVMFLYREDYYKKTSEQEERSDINEVVDLNLAKHRNGSVGHVSLVFNKSISAFYNHIDEGGY